MRANSGSVIATLCALAGVVGLCMTTFGNANIGLTSFNLLLHLKAACRTFLPPERFPCLQSERKKASSLRTGERGMTSRGSNLGLVYRTSRIKFLLHWFFWMCFGKRHPAPVWWTKTGLIETKCCHCLVLVFAEKSERMQSCSYMSV